jgi:hypothetical protein
VFYWKTHTLSTCAMSPSWLLWRVLSLTSSLAWLAKFSKSEPEGGLPPPKLPVLPRMLVKLCFLWGLPALTFKQQLTIMWTSLFCFKYNLIGIKLLLTGVLDRTRRFAVSVEVSLAASPAFLDWALTTVWPVQSDSPPPLSWSYQVYKLIIFFVKEANDLNFV